MTRITYFGRGQAVKFRGLLGIEQMSDGLTLAKGVAKDILPKELSGKD